MFQHGFSGRTDREALPERLGDPLPKTDRVVDRDGFRGELVRTIGLARARFKIGMMNPRLQHPPAWLVGRASLSCEAARIRREPLPQTRGLTMADVEAGIELIFRYWHDRLITVRDFESRAATSIDLWRFP